jgi:hypothetical protein
MYARIFLLLEVTIFNFFFFIFIFYVILPNLKTKLQRNNRQITDKAQQPASEKDNFPFARGEVIKFGNKKSPYYGTGTGTGMVPYLNLFIIVRSTVALCYICFVF